MGQKNQTYQMAFKVYINLPQITDLVGSKFRITELETGYDKRITQEKPVWRRRIPLRSLERGRKRVHEVAPP